MREWPFFISIFFFIFVAPVKAVELKVGDILLQPLKCWSCTLIEEEEETPFSHVGVVMQTAPEILVAEAFGKVRLIPLSDFQQKTEPGSKLLAMRFRNERVMEVLSLRAQEFATYYRSHFDGLKYDHDFRWNNWDENGSEKIYCSELVAKLFLGFMGIELPLKRMHFERNREGWMTYFRGNIPDRQWGISPADIHRSELFYELGEW